ncbi:hypothetical protein FDZ71_09305, partial [bacterium]
MKGIFFPLNAGFFQGDSLIMKKIALMTALAATFTLCLASAPFAAEEKPAADAKTVKEAHMGVSKGAPKEAAKGPEINPGAPVAIVNGSPLTRAEYNRAMAQYIEKLSRQTGGKHTTKIDPNDQMKVDVLEDMVKAEVFYQEAKKTPKNDLEERVNAEFDKLKKRYPGEAEFADAMKKSEYDEKTLKQLIRKSYTVNDYIAEKMAPSFKA